MDWQDLYHAYQKYLPRFITFQRWIYEDLKNSSIQAHANFLVAMGIFNYIEILGSFYRYKKKYKVGKKDYGYVSRFNFAINELFEKRYKREFRKIRDILGVEPYDMFRSGMTHEYLVKTYRGKTGIEIRFTVFGVQNEEEYKMVIANEKCGIKAIRKNSKFYQINIFNPKLVEDLYKACEEYKGRLNADRRNYRMYFVKRCNDINFDLMNPI